MPENSKIVTVESPPVNVKEDEIESEDVPKIRDLTDWEPNPTNHIRKSWGLKPCQVSFCFMFGYVFDNVI